MKEAFENRNNRKSRNNHEVCSLKKDGDKHIVSGTEVVM